MTDLYRQALTGTLPTPTIGPPVSGVTITNALQCHLNIYLMGPDGQRTYLYPALVDAGAVSIKDARINQYYVLTSYISDAFAAVIQVTAAGQAFTINTSMLLGPGDIGPIPKPTEGIVVPPDSPRVLVGSANVSHVQPGKDAPWKCLTREQFWKRSLDSYALAPKQKLSINYTTTTGMQDSTSTQQSLAESLGLNVGAGWGAISAGISGSLSSTSAFLQQITLTTQSTRFDAMTVENPTTDSQMYLRWQLVDVVQIIDMNLPAWKAVVAAVVSAEAPTLVDGPYILKDGNVTKA